MLDEREIPVLGVVEIGEAAVDQALAQLLGVLKAPIGKFVRTLAEPTAKLVRTIAAVKDQKSAAA